MNYIKSNRKREAEGQIIISQVNKLLKEGWSPFAPVAQTHLNIGDQLNQIMDLKKSTLRHRSYQSYKYASDKLIQWVNKNSLSFMPAKDFTPIMAQNYFDSLLRTGIKGRTYNKTKGFLVTIFNMMIDREIIDKNPFKKIRKLPEELGKNLAFSDKKKKDLQAHLKEHNPRLYLFTQFIYFCYIRPLELLRLKVSNVDLKAGMIFIHGDQSKNKKSESVIIPDAFKAQLLGMNLDKHSPDDFLFGYGLESGPDSYSRNTVTRHHHEALKALSIPSQFTLYSWKHTGVMAAYKAGIDLYSIMRQLRHHSLTQTQVYLKSLGLQPNTEFGSKMK